MMRGECAAARAVSGTTVRRRPASAAHLRPREGTGETPVGVGKPSVPDTPDGTFIRQRHCHQDKIIVGAANGDTGVRDWIAGSMLRPASACGSNSSSRRPGEPGSETWKGNTMLAHARRGVGHRHLRCRHNQTLWEPAIRCRWFDPFYRPATTLH